MENTKIEKSIQINALKARVWDVLIRDEHTRNWYAEFSEGAYAETDWNEGSKAVFTDNSRNGMVGKVVTNKPGEELSVVYTGLLSNNVEDYESDGAKAVQGGHETYRLHGENGITQLDVTSGMVPELFEMMSAAWDRALLKIKSLAEGA